MKREKKGRGGVNGRDGEEKKGREGKARKREEGKEGKGMDRGKRVGRQEEKGKERRNYKKLPWPLVEEGMESEKGIRYEKREVRDG